MFDIGRENELFDGLQAPSTLTEKEAIIPETY